MLDSRTEHRRHDDNHADVLERAREGNRSVRECRRKNKRKKEEYAYVVRVDGCVCTCTYRNYLRGNPVVVHKREERCQQAAPDDRCD